MTASDTSTPRYLCTRDGTSSKSFTSTIVEENEKGCGDNHVDVDDMYNIDDDASSSMTSATPGKRKRRRQRRGGDNDERHHHYNWGVGRERIGGRNKRMKITKAIHIIFCFNRLKV